MMMTSLIAVFDSSTAAGTVAGIGMLSAWTAAGVWTLVKHKRAYAKGESLVLRVEEGGRSEQPLDRAA